MLIVLSARPVRIARRVVLERLEDEGPLTTRELPDETDAPWQSSGWTHNKSLRKLLDFMVARGEIAVAGRRGRDPLWDLAERVYPDDPVVPEDEARRIRNERRLRALGIARERTTEVPVDANDVGPTGEAAAVDGVPGEWRVDAELLDAPFRGRAALLSPLDRLVYDRSRIEQLFDFDYQLEMYKPVDKRRWGYWALPVLYGDRLVGKLDATADRKAGVLVVHALHEDEPFTPAMRRAVEAEIDGLAEWLELDRYR